MIIGAGHLTWAAADLDEAGRTLSEKGYALAFSEPCLLNSPEKAPLLSEAGRSSKTLDMRYFKAAKGLCVELVRYALPGRVGGRYAPVYNGAEGISEVSCSVADPERAAGFLREELGFRGAGTTFELRSVLPQWSVKLSLRQEAAPKEPTTLDALGFSCLCLISTSLDRDLDAASRKGDGRTVPFEIGVNGKKIRAAMLRGPEGMLFELMQVDRS